MLARGSDLLSVLSVQMLALESDLLSVQMSGEASAPESDEVCREARCMTSNRCTHLLRSSRGP